jgi:hypothetical protein
MRVHIRFERYADDVIAHRKTEKEAQEMRKGSVTRLPWSIHKSALSARWNGDAGRVSVQP